MSLIVTTDGIDLASIRLFLAVVELGSLSKAADRHGLSQPSVTARLQKLERQLGVDLLERGPTGSRATQSGVRLAPACRELLVSAATLVDHSEQLRDEHLDLPIAATRHVAEHFLADWITAADLGDLRVELIEADTFHVAQAVRGGEAMIGFTDGPRPPIGLRSEVVASESLLPVVGRTHRWFGRRRALAPEDLAGSTLIVQMPGSGTRDLVDAELAGLWTVGEQVQVASATAARLAALNGDGAAFLPRCRVARDLEAGRLAVVRVRDLAIEQSVLAVWRGSRPSARAAQRLLSAISAA